MLFSVSVIEKLLSAVITNNNIMTISLRIHNIKIKILWVNLDYRFSYEISSYPNTYLWTIFPISFFDTPSSNIELNSSELHYNQENIKEKWSNVHNCKKVWLTRRIIFARPVERRQFSTGASVGVPSRFFPTEYTSRSQHRFSISPVAGPNFYHAIGDESFAW